MNSAKNYFARVIKRSNSIEDFLSFIEVIETYPDKITELISEGDN